MNTKILLSGVALAGVAAWLYWQHLQSQADMAKSAKSADPYASFGQTIANANAANQTMWTAYDKASSTGFINGLI